MIALGRRSPALRPCDERDRKRAQRQGRERDAGLQRVVLEDHLQVDGQRDHAAAEADLGQHVAGDAEPEALGPKQVGVDQRGL